MDLKIFQFLHSLVGKSVIFDTFITLLANILPYFLIMGALFFIFRYRNNLQRLFMIIFLGLTLLVGRGLLTETFRFFFPRLRPFQELNFDPLFKTFSPSFPSGHASLLFALSFFIFYFDRKLGIWFFILSFINGLSRIIAGVHWPSDILGGFLIGYLSYFFVLKLIKDYQPKIKT